MGGEVEKYMRYKRIVRYIMLSAGIWPGFQEQRHPLDTFLILLATLCTSFTVYGIVAFCLSNISNINVLVKGLGLVFSFSSSFLKVTMMAVHRRGLVYLNRGISKCFEDDLKNPDFQPHLLARLPFFYKFFSCLKFTIDVNVGLMVIGPLLALRQGKYIRAYPQAIPFDYEPGGAIHWCIYVVEVISGYYLWGMSVAVDTIIGFYALHIAGELRLLSSRFENLNFSKNYKNELKECIDRHILIYRSHQVLQQIFGFLSIWLAISCAIIMCAIIFQSTEFRASNETMSNTTIVLIVSAQKECKTTHFDPSVGKIHFTIQAMKHLSPYRVIYLIMYCLLKLGQAYTYAWSGNIITVESEMCIDSIYKSNWPNSGNLRLMNDVLIIQSQNPLIFKAMDCMFVRLDMFSKIIQTSISYFFLLRTLDTRIEEGT